MITKIRGGMIAMVLLVMGAYTAYASYWTWGALKQQQQRIESIEKGIGTASPSGLQVNATSDAQDTGAAQVAKPAQKSQSAGKWAKY